MNFVDIEYYLISTILFLDLKPDTILTLEEERWKCFASFLMSSVLALPFSGLEVNLLQFCFRLPLHNFYEVLLPLYTSRNYLTSIVFHELKIF